MVTNHVSPKSHTFIAQQVKEKQNSGAELNTERGRRMMTKVAKSSPVMRFGAVLRFRRLETAVNNIQHGLLPHISQSAT
jgi:hypothetical protein